MLSLHNLRVRRRHARRVEWGVSSKVRPRPGGPVDTEVRAVQEGLTCCWNERATSGALTTASHAFSVNSRWLICDREQTERGVTVESPRSVFTEARTGHRVRRCLTPLRAPSSGFRLLTLRARRVARCGPAVHEEAAGKEALAGALLAERLRAWPPASRRRLRATWRAELLLMRDTRAKLSVRRANRVGLG